MWLLTAAGAKPRDIAAAFSVSVSRVYQLVAMQDHVLSHRISHLDTGTGWERRLRAACAIPERAAWSSLLRIEIPPMDEK